VQLDHPPFRGCGYTHDVSLNIRILRESALCAMPPRRAQPFRAGSRCMAFHGECHERRRHELCEVQVFSNPVKTTCLEHASERQTAMFARTSRYTSWSAPQKLGNHPLAVCASQVPSGSIVVCASCGKRVSSVSRRRWCTASAIQLWQNKKPGLAALRVRKLPACGQPGGGADALLLRAALH
jgi:hypothetical protein